MPRAMEIIQTEHRRVAALLHAMEQMLAESVGGAAPDLVLLESMLDYLENFLYLYHHPKEDEHLFKALRRRSTATDSVLRELQHQHRHGDVLLARVRESLDVYRRRGAPALAAFTAAVAEFHAFEHAHIEREEQDILPAAAEHLQQSDWDALSEAFTAHDDPLFGDLPSTRFQLLYEEIVRRVPDACELGGADES